ncbi:MAG: nucleoside transporter C-terminal domain-containing protein [Pseudomonadota bacterium]|nr:nucleoside transporter C-terminal domain-containing protein [Pseudomonadota bacterium]
MNVVSLFGLFGLVGIAWGLSSDRRRFPVRVVVWGLVLQVLFGLVVLSPAAQDFFFAGVDAGVRKLLSFSEQGATFVFASFVPHQIAGPDGVPSMVQGISPPLKTFAFWILPSIIFFSTLMAISYHIGLMQVLVRGMAWLMQRTMGTSGAETLSTAANVFLGQTEAPLLVKPFVARMTRSELFCVMLGGFANTAGGVLAAYVGFLSHIPGIAGHLVTSSILSAPATLVIAKVMMPESGTPVTAGTLSWADERPDRNVMEAAARGATEGMSLALNVAAMLIAFVGLMAAVDWIFSLAPVSFCDAGVVYGWQEGCGALSLSRVLGWVFTPMALLLGVDLSEASTVGMLLGEKLVLTEFVAYIHLGEIMASPTPLSPRSAVIASYALCGFANFASVGIQLGGIGGMAPGRMGDLAELGLRAMIGGTLATFMTACIAGALL